VRRPIERQRLEIEQVRHHVWIRAEGQRLLGAPASVSTLPSRRHPSRRGRGDKGDDGRFSSASADGRRR
jgi:hypothetical protein